VSYLHFQSAAKRLAFVAFAVAAVVLLNGVRATLVMAIASASEMRYLAGEDHIWFGWALFMAYLAGLYWIAWRFGDEAEHARA
jgi:exosortase/archaeosortase family protein